MAIVSTGCKYDFSGRKRKKVKPKGEVYKKFKVNPRTRAEYVAPTTYRRGADVEYKSTDDGSCNTAKDNTNIYTGEQKLLGISTLHKSCLQPVFDKQTAIDNAQMRRN